MVWDGANPLRIANKLPRRSIHLLVPPVPNYLKPMNQQELQKQMAEMIDQIRADNGDLIASMPTDATTPGQEELKRKHGSPRAFAQACNNAIGEISCLEAHTAIAEYKAKWDAA